jgi:hypothetical protein
MTLEDRIIKYFKGKHFGDLYVLGVSFTQEGLVFKCRRTLIDNTIMVGDETRMHLQIRHILQTYFRFKILPDRIQIKVTEYRHIREGRNYHLQHKHNILGRERC